MLMSLLLLPVVWASQCALMPSIGCYTDGTESAGGTNVIRALTLSNTDFLSQATQERCAQFCFNVNATYAAVEFGQQCFCGNEFNPAAKSVSRPMSECNMSCTGDASQLCGAADRMLLLSFECTRDSIPNYQACLGAGASYAFCDMSLTVDERLDDLAGRLTLTEKMNMISPQPQYGDVCSDHTAAVDRLGISQYMWLVETNTAVASRCYAADKCATTFNGPLGFGASFNRSLWELKGSVIGTEMRAFTNLNWQRGFDKSFIGITGYGPNINIARDPRFGRTSEVPGEDPLLSGTYAAHMLQAMQERDANGYPKMAAYLKHFTAYSKETDRGHDTYNISMFDLWDTYLAQYEIAFTQGKPAGAMCSYNGINGHPSCANTYILNEVVRNKWNQTNAHITTDCGAVNNLMGPPINAASFAAAAAMAINNGTDIEMGGTVFTKYLNQSYTEGLVTSAAIEASWRRSYRVHFEAGRFDDPSRIAWSKFGLSDINSTLHQQIQFEAALQSFVLLKNDNAALPLASTTNIAVLGPMGVTQSGLLSDYAGDQQCWVGIGASDPYACIATLAQGIEQRNGGRTTIAKGVDINSADTSGIEPALALGRNADVIVLILGIDKTIEHEGIDRTDTALPGLQEDFAKQVFALNKTTILILSNGGPLAVDDLIAYPEAIVEVYNPSVMGARALAAALFGDENRFGKLPMTMYPHDYINQQNLSNFDMSKPPGRTYRYYTGTPLFPFGAGMSYTSFHLSCTQNDENVTCTVKNTGTRHGDEVVLMYHSAGQDIRNSVNHPVPLRSLVDFTRVSLDAGSEINVTFQVGGAQAMLVNADGVKTLYHGMHNFIFSRGPGLQLDDDVTISVTF